MDIRNCSSADLEAMFSIINDAAEAYRGVIPSDCWHEPYMSMEYLISEIRDGVEFWGIEEEGRLCGIMGIQDRGDVTLIRHAYVKTSKRRSGFGTRLLRYLEKNTEKPILIGTWLAADWAIRFYEKNGYVRQSREETERLLKRYWKIPDRQVNTSIVLADKRISSEI